MIEIERKFLVRSDAWRAQSRACQRLEQGYVDARGATVRVRIADASAFLTLKGPTRGLSRSEFEYAIPSDDARAMLSELCAAGTIEKTRHFVDVGGLEWVVDEFDGAHKGLVLAEVELSSEDQTFVMPDWAGREVSADARYFNSNLIGRPTPPTE